MSCRPQHSSLPQEGDFGWRFARRVRGDPESRLDFLHSELRHVEAMHDDLCMKPALVQLRGQLEAMWSGANTRAELSSSGTSVEQSSTMVFYQSDDGQLIFLESTLTKRLLAEYGDWGSLPQQLEIELQAVREEVVSDETRHRHRFLEHVGGAEVVFIDGEVCYSRIDSAASVSGRDGQRCGKGGENSNYSNWKRGADVRAGRGAGRVGRRGRGYGSTDHDGFCEDACGSGSSALCTTLGPDIDVAHAKPEHDPSTNASVSTGSPLYSPVEDVEGHSAIHDGPGRSTNVPISTTSCEPSGTTSWGPGSATANKSVAMCDAWSDDD